MQDGYITSDCDADADVYNKHHYYKTPEETVAGVLKAGTDVDCTSFVSRTIIAGIWVAFFQECQQESCAQVGQHAQSALDKKLIDEADIDVRLANLFKVRMRTYNRCFSFALVPQRRGCNVND